MPIGFIQEAIMDSSCTLYLDFGSGSFRDFSNLGNHGTPNVATKWNSNSLDLSASGADVIVTSAASLECVNGTIVIFGQFSGINEQPLIYKRDGIDIQYELSAGPGNTFTLTDDSAVRTCSVSGITGISVFGVSWEDGELAEGFVNGVSVGNFSGITNITPNSGDLIIGRNATTSTQNDRFVKAVLIFNRKLTAGEHARLNEDIRAELFDSSQYHRIATIDLSQFIDLTDSSLVCAYEPNPILNQLFNMKSASYNTTLKNQVLRQGSFKSLHNSFDGNSLDTGISSANLDPATESHTCSCWIKFNSLPTELFAIMGKGLGGASYPSTAASGVSVDSTGKIVYSHYDGTSYITRESYIIPVGAWTHIAYSIDHVAGTVTLYVNGLSHATVSSANITTTADNFRIFGVNSSHADLKDSVDVEFGMYQIHSEAKNQVWISKEFASGSVALWKLGFGTKETIINNSSGKLSNSLFDIISGSWKIDSESISGKFSKNVICQTAGVISMKISKLGEV